MSEDGRKPVFSDSTAKLVGGISVGIAALILILLIIYCACLCHRQRKRRAAAILRARNNDSLEALPNRFLEIKAMKIQAPEIGSCSICLEKFEESKVSVSSPCDHTFHARCL